MGPEDYYDDEVAEAYLAFREYDDALVVLDLVKQYMKINKVEHIRQYMTINYVGYIMMDKVAKNKVDEFRIKITKQIYKDMKYY